MGADIVNIVDGKFSGRSFIHLPYGDWADLRAEIVRLRGEVESRQLSSDVLAEACVRAGVPDSIYEQIDAELSSIAPAEAKNKWAPPYPDAAKDPFNALLTTPPAPVQTAPQEGEDAAEAYRKAWEAGHAAACELVVDDAMVERVCRNHFPDWDMYGPAGKMVRSADIRRLLTAALQHRGDSRGGEGS